jgi:hypothetical protein
MRFRSSVRAARHLALVCAALMAGCESEGGDGGAVDSGTLPDAAPLDAAMDAAPEAGTDGSTSMDGATDAAPPIDAAPDAQPDAEQDAAPDSSTPITAPEHLSETGLYQPGSSSELAEGVMTYVPRYELWSDGAEKARFLYLPEGTTIDTSDIDALVFPVGTKAWKEFSRDGSKLETRLLWKTGDGWVRVAYAWNEAQDDAVAVPRGAQNVLGTDHDIPQRIDCRECHDGSPDTLLGVSAIQLAHDLPGVTLAQLEADGWLSAPPPANIARPDTLEWNALGYLHANCGNCHNPLGGGFERVDLDLWLRVGQLGDVTSTESWKTTVSYDIEQTSGDDLYRIAPGAAEDSALITRMKLRDVDEAMPPLASELTDDAGIGLLEDWIESIESP